MAKNTGAPHFLPYPEADDNNNVPADMKALAEKVDSELDAIAPGQLVGGAAGKLLICGSTGAGAFKAMSGDATIDKEGNLQLGAGVVDTATLADKAVTTAKVDDGAVTSAKLGSGAALANLASGSIPTDKLSQAKLTWYTPKVIATEQSRTNTSFGKMATPDEISGIVVPENALLLVGYSANWKAESGSGGRAAIFLGTNQLKANYGTQEATASTALERLTTYAGGLIRNSAEIGTEFSATGEVLGNDSFGGFCIVQRLAAGTYTLSIQFKATSGAVTVRDRALWAAVLG